MFLLSSGIYPRKDAAPTFASNVGMALGVNTKAERVIGRMAEAIPETPAEPT